MPSDRAGADAGQFPLQEHAWRNSEDRYATLSMTLHWLMLALLLAVYGCIELRELYPKGSDPREALKTWHYMLGMSVLFVVWLRIAIIAMAGPKPPVRPEARPWQDLAATGMHLALYLLMIGMPLVGWIILSAEGKAVPFFVMQLPALVGENKELAGLAKEIHESAGTVGYWMIGLHAAASLFHHYIRRDNTLRRMLPWGH